MVWPAATFSLTFTGTDAISPLSGATSFVSSMRVWAMATAWAWASSAARAAEALAVAVSICFCDALSRSNRLFVRS